MSVPLMQDAESKCICDNSMVLHVHKELTDALDLVYIANDFFWSK